ncbi:FliH/SctL family protein [Mesobacillus maritimus]|uniref:FliH/SctL family protein n=1 Tax=Mesobacillus maritimus TaxID=1643336 RepID=UPI00384ACF68
MSNIFRIPHREQVEKRIIGTKKIEVKITTDSPNELSPIQQKQFLQQEIVALQEQSQQLQTQLETERAQAKAEIEHWWLTKQEEAQLEAKRLGDEASEQGYQEGFQQGMLQAEAEFQQKRQEMQQLLETAYEERNQIIQQSELFLLSLSVKIAEKVIKGELKQHNEQLLNLVKQALKQVEEKEDVVIQMAPEDYPVLLPFMDELKPYVGPDSELKVIPVPHFTKGGCMIHTESGSYDVTVTSQLEEIKQHLLAYCEEKTNS